MRRRIWAGLESKGLSPMGPELLAHLRARVQRLGRWRWIWIALMPVLGVAPCAFARAVEDSIEGSVAVVAVVVGLTALFGPAACLLAAGDAHARRRRLLAEISRAEVEVFEGTAGVATDAVPDAVLRLIERGELGGRAQRVEVLPVSGYLASIDGKLRSDLLALDILEVAPARAPLPVDPEILAAGSREVALTADEREEMRARATQLWRTPGALLGPILYAALGVIMWRAQGSAWLDRYWPMLVIAGVMGTLSLIGLMIRYRSAVRVQEDAELGVALEIIEPDPDGVLHRLVVLQRSGMVWSVDELPAEWRSRRT